MDRLQIWRAAHLLIKQHGKDAAVVAALRAAESLPRGDHVGRADWLEVSRTVLEIWRGTDRAQRKAVLKLRRASRPNAGLHMREQRKPDPGL